MKITVTERDIKRANKLIEERSGPHKNCPIALAAKRAFKNYSLVCGSATIWNKDISKELGALPKEARKFVRDFDADKPVAPFSFTTL